MFRVEPKQDKCTVSRGFAYLAEHKSPKKEKKKVKENEAEVAVTAQRVDVEEDEEVVESEDDEVRK